MYALRRAVYATMAFYLSDLVICDIARDAEAGGILGVNTPHFFGLTPPLLGGT